MKHFGKFFTLSHLIFLKTHPTQCVSEVGNFLPLDQCEEVWKDEGALVAGVHLLSHLLHGHHDQELHHSDGDSVMVDMMLLLLVVVVVMVVVMLNTNSVSGLMNYVFFNVNVTAHHHTHHSDNFSDRSQA